MHNNSCADYTYVCVIISVNPPKILAFTTTSWIGSSQIRVHHGRVVKIAFYGNILNQHSSELWQSPLQSTGNCLDWPNNTKWGLCIARLLHWCICFLTDCWCTMDKLLLRFLFPLLQDTGPDFLSHRDVHSGGWKCILKFLDDSIVGKILYFPLKEKKILFSVIAIFA